MPAVSSEPVFGELLGNDKRKPVVLPFAVASGHGNNIRVTQLLKSLRGESRTRPACTIHNDGRRLVVDCLLNLHFEKTTRQENGARKVPFVPFVLFAHVEQDEVVV